VGHVPRLGPGSLPVDTVALSGALRHRAACDDMAVGAIMAHAVAVKPALAPPQMSVFDQ